MSDPTRELIQVIRDLVVAPLQQFQSMASMIDYIHSSSYHNFTANINSLFSGYPPAIHGSGAEAITEKMEEYQYAERNEVGHGGGSLSLLIDQGSFYCNKAASKISALCDSYPFYDHIHFTWKDLLPGFIDLMFEVYTSELEITKFLNIPNKKYMVYSEQLDLLTDMGVQRRTWGYKMAELYNEPSLEPPLPTPPNNLPISFISLPPVTLTEQQQRELADIMGILATEGLKDIPRQYIEVLLSEGFSEDDILASISGWNRAGKTPQQISDLLYLAAFHILLGPYYRNDMVPRGMTPEQYQNFLSTLRGGLKDAGYCVGAGVGGSTVTGYKYTTGRPFDADPTDPSDYDLALADPKLLQKAESLGIKLRDGRTHTGPLTQEQLQELGLWDLVQKLEGQTGREVHFMIYNSLTATSARAPYIYFFGDSCAA